MGLDDGPDQENYVGTGGFKHHSAAAFTAGYNVGFGGGPCVNNNRATTANAGAGAGAGAADKPNSGNNNIIIILLPSIVRSEQ